MRSLDGLDVAWMYVDILDRDSIMKTREGVDGVFHLATVYALGSPEIGFARSASFDLAKSDD